MNSTEPPVNPVEPTKSPDATPVDALTPTSTDRNLALLAHLTGGLGILISGLGGFIGPLVIWILKKDESGFVAEQAREALNFQITLLILYAAMVVLAVVSCGTGIFLLAIPGILQVVFAVLASLSVSKGVPYRYPFNLRLVT